VKSGMYVLVLVLLIGIVGCSDDDNGGTAPQRTGRVVINPQPEGIEAPWSIAGPDEYEHVGTGSAELTGRAPGEYAVVWGSVVGHVTPDNDTKTLAAGGTVTFTGVYTEDEDPTPPPRFVYIEPGTFTMGSPEDEPGRDSDEGPQHQVTLTRGFFMSQYEVTEEWWNEVMGGDPTTSQLPKWPVSWDMAVQFCNALSVRENLTPAYEIHGPRGNVTWDQNADGYRLPTEAEWEYACRAGSTTAFANGPITHTRCEPLDPNLSAMGWYCGNRTGEDGPAEVGQKQANQWGLYDMHGNVWEWVWCGWRAYASAPQEDPVTSPEPGAGRVVRGGGWYSHARYCRSAHRYYVGPGNESDNVGFRPARSAF